MQSLRAQHPAAGALSYLRVGPSWVSPSHLMWRQVQIGRNNVAIWEDFIAKREREASEMDTALNARAVWSLN